MDKTQIITIIITAVIAAVIKEIISAVVKGVPSVTAKLKKGLVSTLRQIMWKYWRVLFDAAMMAFLVIMLRYCVLQFPTVSRGSVIIMAYFASWLVYWNVELIKDIRRI
jgi:hypothetical protein